MVYRHLFDLAEPELAPRSEALLLTMTRVIPRLTNKILRSQLAFVEDYFRQFVGNTLLDS
jgi:hypothetical protein